MVIARFTHRMMVMRPAVSSRFTLPLLTSPHLSPPIASVAAAMDTARLRVPLLSPIGNNVALRVFMSHSHTASLSTQAGEDALPKIPSFTPSAEESRFLKAHMEEIIAKKPVHTPECGHPNLPRDLEDCGTNLCWAIAVMDVIASTLLIKGGNYELIKLNCDKLMVDCHEGSDYPPIIIKAFKHMKEHNISKDSYYPGEEELKDLLPDNNNNIPEEVKALRLKGFEMVDHMDEFAIMEALDKGPIVAGVRQSPEFIVLGDKIYKGSDNEVVIGGKHCNHGLVVVGGYVSYNKEEESYWTVKNSLGTRWGDNGYGKVALYSSLPEDKKPLLTNIMYPVYE